MVFVVWLMIEKTKAKSCYLSVVVLLLAMLVVDGLELTYILDVGSVGSPFHSSTNSIEVLHVGNQFNSTISDKHSKTEFVSVGKICSSNHNQACI